MSYTDSLLASGERRIRTAHQHWFILVWRARWAVVGLLIGILVVVLKVINRDTSGQLWDLLGWVTLVLILIGVVSLAWGWLQYQAEEYVITSRRIIHTEGVVNKKVSDSSLEKINDAILVETLFGRIFGFGNLEVLTASELGIDNLHMLRDAKDFKKAMLEAKHDLELEMMRPTMPPVRAADSVPAAAAPATAASAPVPAPGPRVDTADEITDSLQRLGDLRDKGILSPEEFEAKKQELLDRL